MTIIAKPATCLLFSSFLLILFSCKKDMNGSGNPPAQTHDIYVLGYEEYWKNGVANILKPSDPFSYAVARMPHSLFLSGTDIYGLNLPNFIPGHPSSAIVYKNTTATTLPITPDARDARAYGLFVSGNDVYIGGMIDHNPFFAGLTPPFPKSQPFGNIAVVWKNGIITPMQSPSVLWANGGDTSVQHDDYVSSVFVAGNDIYVAGGSFAYQLGTPSTYHFTWYWKNGTPVDLPVPELTVNSPFAPDNSLNDLAIYPVTTDIFVSGNDVYVLGKENTSLNNNTNYQYTRGIYWKNGVIHYLDIPAGASPSTYASTGNAIYAVENGDVYIAGHVYTNGLLYAAVWKNGAPTLLTSGSSSVSPDVDAESVIVFGNDVYVAGYQTIDGHPSAMYWKNGVATTLAKDAMAYSIQVK